MKRALIVASIVAIAFAWSAAMAADEPASKPTTAPATQPVKMDADHKAQAQKLLEGGVKYLLSNQRKDGGWSLSPEKDIFVPGATAIVLKSIINAKDLAAVNAEDVDKAVKKGMEVLLSFRQKDGSVYAPKEGQPAYNTALAVMALKAANDPQYNEAISDAVKYLKGLQVAPGQDSPDGKKVDEKDPRNGGIGYGKAPNFQPNLSVHGFVMEAWEEAGVKSDDPAVQNALKFLTRLQNNSETNKEAFAKDAADDGGFRYSLDESKAGNLRSYGSMTYVGYKQLLYAGVGKDDKRVLAAKKWIEGHWTLDANPGLPDKKDDKGNNLNQQGLYYYYHMFAKALQANGEPVVKDSKGVQHNWRNELVDALKKRVHDDGSWHNDADRWEEGSPVLVTAYIALALEEAMK